MILGRHFWLLLIAAIVVSSCKEEEQWVSLEVVASAYNSTHRQTDGNPFITAWGDTLHPTTKSIAVSGDLIKKGLTHNTQVKIEGFEGIYVVNDKMHPKWRNKIDIYFGTDIEAARDWGRRKVKIHYLCK
jgi:3D (Asp-Asp-Asp) domain-containing protein